MGFRIQGFLGLGFRVFFQKQGTLDDWITSESADHRFGISGSKFLKHRTFLGGFYQELWDRFRSSLCFMLGTLHRPLYTKIRVSRPLEKRRPMNMLSFLSGRLGLFWALWDSRASSQQFLIHSSETCLVAFCKKPNHFPQ